MSKAKLPFGRSSTRVLSEVKKAILSPTAERAAGAKPVTSSRKFEGHVDTYINKEIRGWAIDTGDRSRPNYVCLVIDNVLSAVSKTGIIRDDVNAAHGTGHPCGFIIDLSQVNLRNQNVRVLTVDYEAGLSLEKLLEARDTSIDDHPVSFEEIKKRCSQHYVLPINPEINFLSDSKIAVNKSAAGTIFIEITDLVSYLQSHTTVTGIQRTVCGIAYTLIQSGNTAHQPFSFCYLLEKPGTIAVFDNQELLGLIETVFEGRGSVDSLRTAIGNLFKSSATYTPTKGDNIFISGAYWIVSNFDQRLAAIKSAGSTIGAYIYDIIPITSPQWVATNTNREVLETAYSVFYLCDYFVTISKFVKGDLLGLLQKEMLLQKPVDVAQLPHILPSAENATESERNVAPTAPFVLCVCTLEGRKNHMLLFRVWAALLRKYRGVGVPDLVLVGRWGWRIEDFRTVLDESNHLGGKIIVKSGLNDHELAELYRQCSLTVFPSFVEGWGLPVGESLSFGKFCVASNASSVPEVGESFVDYFDPYDFDDAFTKIERAVFDREYLENRTAEIVRDFKPRTWEDLVDTLMLSVTRQGKAAADQTSNLCQIPPLLEASRIWSLKGVSSSPIVSWLDKKIRFILAENWNQLEDWGAWSKAPSAKLSFRTEFKQKTSIKLWLELRLPNRYSGEVVRIDSMGSFIDLTGKPFAETPSWVEVNTTTDEEGLVNLVVRRPKFYGKVEPNRSLFIGFSSLFYCEYGNEAEELRFIRSVAGLITTS